MSIDNMQSLSIILLALVTSGLVVVVARWRERGEVSARGKDEHFSVTVRRNGEHVVTIETNMLSGRSLSPEDEAAIRQAARNLLGFIGEVDHG